MRLIICEKNNAARRISSILSDGKVKSYKRGKVPIYQFDWNGSETYTIGLRGHILNMDFPRKYNNWQAVDPKDLIEVIPKKKISEKNIAPVLRSLCDEAKEILIATDYDREGELIGLEALEYVKGKESIRTAKRARFSSLTPGEIIDSFNNLAELDQNLADSAETRQVIDLYWGASLTRFISLASERLGHDYLSVGRVQSPTLALIVNKEKVISDFKPTPYWVIEGYFSKMKVEFQANHSAGDIFDKEEAKERYGRVKDQKKGDVVYVKGRTRVDRPPTPFNTTKLIRAANTLGMQASRIMSVAESLYNDGYISYPRTDNTVYPKNLDLREVCEKFTKGPFREAADHILSKEKISPTRGKKQTTDHPPIYPTEYATRSELGGDKWKLYDLIVRRFLATLHDPCRVKVTKVKIDVKGEEFRGSGIEMEYPGWRNVYTISKVKEVTLPELSEGDPVNIERIDMLDKETKPPNRFSQGGLIQEMEKLGLGTKSTRHEIIKKLYDRRYIKDSPPKPTLSGETLINSLEKHAGHVTKPKMTSKLEKDMENISNGKMPKDEVIEESRKMLNQILTELEHHKEKIGKELSDALKEQDVVGLCPRCNNPLMMTRSKWGKRYVRCSMAPGCSKSYPLPQRGKIEFTGEICDHCRSPIMILYRSRRRPFTTCINPKCPGKEKDTKERDKDDRDAKN